MDVRERGVRGVRGVGEARGEASGRFGSKAFLKAFLSSSSHGKKHGKDLGRNVTCWYLLVFFVAQTGAKIPDDLVHNSFCCWGMRLKVVLENECGTNKLWIGGTKRKTNDIWEICGKYILMCPVAVTSYVRRKRHCSLLKGTAEAWHARLHFQRTSSQDSGCQNFPYLSPPYVPPRISRWPVLPTAVKIIVQKQVEGFEKFPELIWKFRRNVGKTVSGSNPLPIFTKWGVFKKFC